jgi:hypothetical protein
MAIVCRVAAAGALRALAGISAAVTPKLAALAELAVAGAAGAAAYLLLMRILCPDALRELAVDFRSRRKRPA